MHTPSSRRAATVAVAAAIALGVAGGALAQSGAAGAGSASDEGMPEIQRQGDVSFVSGGVGSDETSALKRAQHDWPLAMRFTGPGSEFIADVHVRIVSASEGAVLDADSRGPYMLVRLRPGRYSVHAVYDGIDQRKTVTIPYHGAARLDFRWDRP
jgi:hypothetical protein